MEKIVKYCPDCEESFAEKFSFCPNCANQLTAFEMKPVGEDLPNTEKTEAVDLENDAAAAAGSALPENFGDEILDQNFLEIEDAKTDDILEIEPAKVSTTAEKNVTAATTTDLSNETVETNLSKETIEAKSSGEVIEEEEEFEPEVETAPLAASAVYVPKSGNGNGRKAFSAVDNNFAKAANNPDKAFNVTVIEEQNGKQRYGLLLGTMAIVLSVAFGSLIYSLFNYDALVGAIGTDGTMLATLIDEVPMQVEEKPPIPDEDKGGGGGGGGKNETKPASKGQLPTQTDKPTFPPSVTIPKISNPTLPVEVSTQGKIKRKTTEERYGLPDSLSDDLSNGPGSGGGIGRGRGTGVGSGLGTGEGSGTGSGSGSGTGTGTGSGTGPGSGRDRTVAVEKKPEPAGPSQKFRITAKPRADYTDEAREKNITGVVSLRVTLNANGSVGSISPINRLPYGLTEKAIAAARRIQFEPQLKNGVPQTVRIQIQYDFTIY